MQFPPYLTEAILLKRHNRFLADVALGREDKRLITCLNEGYLRGCDTLGSRVWFSENDSGPQKFIWELTEVDGGHLAAVNQENSYQLLIEAIEKGTIKELSAESLISFKVEEQSEHKPTPGSCFVAVQDVTWADEIGRGFFPEGIQNKASDQLQALMRRAYEGYRAVLCLCVKNTGIKQVIIAPHLDPQYAALFQDAQNIGVECIAYGAHISLTDIFLKHSIPIQITG